MNHTTSDLPAPAEFTQVQLREGYAIAEVDAFVARALESVRATPPTMRPTEVAAVRFTPVRLRPGYDMREVDTWLDALEQHLTARLPEGAEEPEEPVATGRRWTLRALLPVLVIVLGGAVGLVDGLLPGGPSARETTVIGLVGAAALVGLGVVVVQLVTSLLAVVAGAVRVVRRVTDRTA
jgi:DivIVA domain-containing protein